MTVPHALPGRGIEVNIVGYAAGELPGVEGHPWHLSNCAYTDVAEAEKRAAEYGEILPEVTFAVLPVGAPLTAEQIAAIKAGEPLPLDEDAVDAAVEAFIGTEDAPTIAHDMRLAISAYLQAVAATESKTR